MFRSLNEMKTALDEQFTLDRGQVSGFRKEGLQPSAVDAFARNAVFNPDPTLRTHLRRALRSAAAFRGVASRTLQNPVEHLSHRQDGCLLTLRLGGHCYDLMRLVMRAARSHGVAGLVFEQGWAGQSPWEFSALLSAAALREEWATPLYMRCCLPPLASDLLPGGLDPDSLEERLAQAANAEFHNVCLRISPAGLLRARSRDELKALMRLARREGMSVNLRVQDPGHEDGEELLRAQAIATDEVQPLLLALPHTAQEWAPERRRTWLQATGALGISISGPTAPEVLARPPLRPVLECRVDFRWVERIVLAPEFSKATRSQLLPWLRSFDAPSHLVDDHDLLRRHEFKALGHLDFQLWDLEGLPRMREESIAELGRVFHALRLATPESPSGPPDHAGPSAPLSTTTWEKEFPGLL